MESNQLAKKIFCDLVELDQQLVKSPTIRCYKQQQYFLYEL